MTKRIGMIAVGLAVAALGTMGVLGWQGGESEAQWDRPAAPSASPPASPSCENGPDECPCLAADEATDDRRILATFSASLSGLVKQGKTTKVPTLIEQLSRRQCVLKLPAAPRGKVDPVALYARARKSVVLMGGIYKCKKCTKWHTSAATGFVVAAPNVVVTNYHVIENKDRSALGALTADGKVYPVIEVLAGNKAADVALVKLGGAALPPLALREGAPVGTRVWVVSHPDHKFWSFTEGMISRRFWEVRAGKRTRRLSITADFARGSSGGPVLDETGAVVGMVASTKSIYYKRVKNVDTHLQMVVKSCVTARSLLDCVKH